MYSLIAEGDFDSAHFLADYYGKCENLHGHRWHAVVTVGTEELQKEGTMKDMVLDFGVFKRDVKEVCKSLDHTFLIEEGTLSDATLVALQGEGFSLTLLPFRTTAENLAKYIYDIMDCKGYDVLSVEVDETPNNRAVYSA